jgi:hypothetical protein
MIGEIICKVASILIACFEKKIQATLARIWGEDEHVLEEA